jgi:transcriptional regulator with XRE-family HTH domain
MTETDTTPTLQARRAAALTQLTLASRAGVSLGTVRMAEKFGFLTPATAVRLAAALGVAPEQLLGSSMVSRCR